LHINVLGVVARYEDRDPFGRLLKYTRQFNGVHNIVVLLGRAPLLIGVDLGMSSVSDSGTVNRQEKITGENRDVGV